VYFKELMVRRRRSMYGNNYKKCTPPHPLQTTCRIPENQWYLCLYPQVHDFLIRCSQVLKFSQILWKFSKYYKFLWLEVEKNHFILVFILCANEYIFEAY
jgi:hypothetical protein